MCKLDFSKVFMSGIHYDCIKNKYSSNSGLLFTVADSFIYEINRFVSEDFSKYEEMLDFSNYSVESIY